MMAGTAHQQSERAPTGIEGLDGIIGGGLPRGEIYLVRGGPGTGKTTLGLQFLMDGAAKGETALILTMSQTESGLRKIAASHGWSLDGVQVSGQLGAGSGGDAAEQTIFQTAVVELGETMSSLMAEIERTDPDRVFIDSIGPIRQLADAPLRYQRQLLSLRDFLSERRATVLIADSNVEPDPALEDLVHGTLVLDRNSPDYGDARRSVHLTKMRGLSFHGGNHNFRIRTGGLHVFPRLEPCAGKQDLPGEAVERGSTRSSAGGSRPARPA
ncbi:ATPase domain-containing protein [Caenispirillum salinarum]|uniref:ATPase domain-containing protein n=1 Tax=Caenispirillum salinarum TaxID=859058 RepID=UPI0038508295